MFTSTSIFVDLPFKTESQSRNTVDRSFGKVWYAEWRKVLLSVFKRIKLLSLTTSMENVGNQQSGFAVPVEPIRVSRMHTGQKTWRRVENDPKKSLKAVGKKLKRKKSMAVPRLSIRSCKRVEAMMTIAVPKKEQEIFLRCNAMKINIQRMLLSRWTTLIKK